jgi:hypothetical protein
MDVSATGVAQGNALWNDAILNQVVRKGSDFQPLHAQSPFTLPFCKLTREIIAIAPFGY